MIQKHNLILDFKCLANVEWYHFICFCLQYL